MIAESFHPFYNLHPPPPQPHPTNSPTSPFPLCTSHYILPIQTNFKVPNNKHLQFQASQNKTYQAFKSSISPPTHPVQSLKIPTSTPKATPKKYEHSNPTRPIRVAKVCDMSLCQIQNPILVSPCVPSPTKNPLPSSPFHTHHPPQKPPIFNPSHPYQKTPAVRST